MLARARGCQQVWIVTNSTGREGCLNSCHIGLAARRKVVRVVVRRDWTAERMGCFERKGWTGRSRLGRSRTVTWVSLGIEKLLE